MIYNIEYKNLEKIVELFSIAEVGYNIGNLDVYSLLYLLKLIIQVERPGLEKNFLPGNSPKVINDKLAQYVFEESNDIKDLPDIITYKLILDTPANMGGPKQPHQSPFHQKPFSTGEYQINGQYYTRYSMFYDVTLQFDFFTKTQKQLFSLTKWFKTIMYDYRDFIKMMGASEFIFRSRFHDEDLIKQYQKYSINIMSIQYFARFEEVHLKNDQIFEKIRITINNEISKNV